MLEDWININEVFNQWNTKMIILAQFFYHFIDNNLILGTLSHEGVTDMR